MLDVPGGRMRMFHVPEARMLDVAEGRTMLSWVCPPLCSARRRVASRGGRK